MNGQAPSDRNLGWGVKDVDCCCKGNAEKESPDKPQNGEVHVHNYLGMKNAGFFQFEFPVIEIVYQD